MPSTPHCSSVLIHSTCHWRQRTYALECFASDDSSGHTGTGTGRGAGLKMQVTQGVLIYKIVEESKEL